MKLSTAVIVALILTGCSEGERSEPAPPEESGTDTTEVSIYSSFAEVPFEFSAVGSIVDQGGRDFTDADAIGTSVAQQATAVVRGGPQNAGFFEGTHLGEQSLDPGVYILIKEVPEDGSSKREAAFPEAS